MISNLMNFVGGSVSFMPLPAIGSACPQIRTTIVWEPRRDLPHNAHRLGAVHIASGAAAIFVTESENDLAGITAEDTIHEVCEVRLHSSEIIGWPVRTIVILGQHIIHTRCDLLECIVVGSPLCDVSIHWRMGNSFLRWHQGLQLGGELGQERDSLVASDEILEIDVNSIETLLLNDCGHLSRHVCSTLVVAILPAIVLARRPTAAHAGAAEGQEYLRSSLLPLLHFLKIAVGTNRHRCAYVALLVALVLARLPNIRNSEGDDDMGVTLDLVDVRALQPILDESHHVLLLAARRLR